MESIHEKDETWVISRRWMFVSRVYAIPWIMPLTWISPITPKTREGEAIVRKVSPRVRSALMAVVLQFDGD